mmetsp:Transcript_1975/g.3292  ORF Transcript_1975/g.3292 Transcript_1975/m.3292 type:complete len:127 (+) Transcript_1975:162-542(+)
MVENKDDSDPMAAALEKAKPIFAQMSFGSVMGFCSGYALKKVGKATAVVLGCGFIALQTCVSYGYLKVDWQKISESAQKKVDANEDGKFDYEDVKIYWQKLKALLTREIPGSAGFSLGFLVGIKNG